MRINDYIEHSEIYGFEPTFVIWTQGCSIRCEGCWNTFTWDFDGGKEIKIEDLVNIIKNSKDKSVTILGGEPLDQEEECLQLLKELRKLNLGIILYTGREAEEINQEVFNYVDILICGPFVKEKRIFNHQLIGSSNQRVLYITNRYKEKDLYNGTHVEMYFDENTGEIEIIGYPEDFKKFFSDSCKKGG